MSATDCVVRAIGLRTKSHKMALIGNGNVLFWSNSSTLTIPGNRLKNRYPCSLYRSFCSRMYASSTVLSRALCAKTAPARVQAPPTSRTRFRSSTDSVSYDCPVLQIVRMMAPGERTRRSARACETRKRESTCTANGVSSPSALGAMTPSGLPAWQRICG